MPNWKLSSKDWLRSTATLPSFEGKQQETEAQTKARLAALEAQLAAKDAELAKQTEQERKAYHKEITDRAVKRTLELNEEESRF